MIGLKILSTSIIFFGLGLMLFPEIKANEQNKILVGGYVITFLLSVLGILTGLLLMIWS